MSEFQLLKKLILDGIELTYGKLTLCDLQNYGRFRGPKRWQIYCDDKRIFEEKERTKNKEEKGCYLIYLSLDEALSKFLQLKCKINSKIR